MATQVKDRRAEFFAALRGGLGQFRDLNPNQPGQWPLLPRLTVWAVVVVFVVIGGWFLWLSDQADSLQAVQRFIAEDPYMLAGVYADVQVRPWQWGLGLPGAAPPASPAPGP